MEALGLSFTEEDRAAMEQCMADNARENRPQHKYSAEEFGLAPEGIARDFSDYHERYLEGAES